MLLIFSVTLKEVNAINIIMLTKKFLENHTRENTQLFIVLK